MLTPALAGPVTEATEPTERAASSVLSILSCSLSAIAASPRPPAGGPGHPPGFTTRSSTRTPLHERRHLGCVALAASVAAEKVEDAQRRGGREEQPLRRFGLGRSMVVR